MSCKYELNLKENKTIKKKKRKKAAMRNDNGRGGG